MYIACKLVQKQCLYLTLPNGSQCDADEFWNELSVKRSKYENVVYFHSSESNNIRIFLSEILGLTDEQIITERNFSMNGIQFMLNPESFKRKNAVVFEKDLSRVKPKDIAYWLDIPMREFKWLLKHKLISLN